jgi:hypothetical protein
LHKSTSIVVESSLFRVTEYSNTANGVYHTPATATGLNSLLAVPRYWWSRGRHYNATAAGLLPARESMLLPTILACNFIGLFFSNSIFDSTGIILCPNNVNFALPFFLLFKNSLLGVESNLVQLSVVTFNPIFYDFFFFNLLG